MASAENIDETKKCKNCRSEIPVASFTLHEVHCSRRVRYCEMCDLGVLISDWADHQDQSHSFTNCPKCTTAVVKNQLEKHVENDCPYRKVQCDQCELELNFKDLAAHEDYCKTRTEFCEGCRKYINVRSFETHDCQPDPVEDRPDRQGAFGNPVFAGLDESFRFSGVDSTDADTRLIMNMQLQEIQRARARAAMETGAVMGDGAVSELYPFGLSSRESTFAAGDNSRMPCPNCNDLVSLERMESHLLLCTDSSTESGNQNQSPQVTTPTNPITLDDEDDDDDSGVALARCEFCWEFFAKDRFIEHFQNCVDGHTTSSLPHRRLALSDSESSDSDVVVRDHVTPDESNDKIPCEFCDKLISFAEFESHIFVCNKSRSASPVVTNGTTSMRHNGRQQPLVRREAKPKTREPNNKPNDSLSQLLPCEFCYENIEAEQLMAHQLECTSAFRDRFQFQDTAVSRQVPNDRFSKPTLASRPGYSQDYRPGIGETQNEEEEPRYTPTEPPRNKFRTEGNGAIGGQYREQNVRVNGMKTRTNWSERQKCDSSTHPTAPKNATSKRANNLPPKDTIVPTTSALNGNDLTVGRNGIYSDSSKNYQKAYKTGSSRQYTDDQRTSSNYRNKYEREPTDRLNGVSRVDYDLTAASNARSTGLTSYSPSQTGVRNKTTYQGTSRNSGTSTVVPKQRSTNTGVTNRYDRKGDLVTHNDNLRRAPVTREPNRPYDRPTRPGKSKNRDGKEREQ
ncbi:uncharacterized protein LOC142336151 [Convolutriloba macropyga]|uniref:uncharacterized protein LOC142336151 n=1 Tax=Convolutriloba macropyga TaxID=536237 RepID=UPI003F5258B5